jgi:CHAT domain-containing protein
VVGKQGLVRLVDLGETASLGKVIDTWRRGFGCTSESAEAGQQLRTAIWEPIEDQLGEGRAGKPNLVLVSPDGALGRLPLAALPGRKPDSYVLEDWPLAVIPAPQALPRLLGSQGVRKPEGNLLVLGDVDYDARSIVPAAQPKKPFPAAHRYPPRGEADALFRRLDGTRGELAAIEKMYRNNFGDAGLKTLEGPHATKDALAREASRHFCLHLATHGFFADPKFRSALERSGRDLGGTELVSRQSLSGYHPGLLSGLALAGANKPDAEDDGILTAEEVATLDLTGMDLAVLSACETGLGEVAGGEGLLGLQRAFQTAGARTVVASLWKVDDVATRDLMERFYDHLWNKNQGKLAALREAQLWMLRDRGRRGLTPLEDEEKRLKSNRLPPYYWAAFVLSGDWR